MGKVNLNSGPSSQVTNAINNFDKYQSKKHKKKHKHRGSLFGKLNRTLSNIGLAASIASTVPYVIKARRENMPKKIDIPNNILISRTVRRRVTPIPSSGLLLR